MQQSLYVKAITAVVELMHLRHNYCVHALAVVECRWLISLGRSTQATTYVSWTML